MSEKSLKSHAIKIQGKEYITVASRVIYFNEIYPQGAIHTELLTNPESDFVLFKATVYPDIEKTPQRAFIGHSQATWDDGYINKTSAIENAETSSIGRALAAMGIGVIESIASADEINKAETYKPRTFTNQTTGEVTETCQKCGAGMKVSKEGKKYCSALCWKKQKSQPEPLPTITKEELMEELPW